ncbi:MAG: cation transporter [Methanothrix sp.]|nr:cation transporter [Methanothrix sp.]
MMQHPSKSIESRFLISIALTCSIFIIELVGGWWTGSLALQSDAAHVFLDVFALVLSYAALHMSSLPADENHTFGYHRLEVFASLINGITLAIISAGIFWEAYRRLVSPQPVMGIELLAIAVLGLVGNLVVAFILGGHHQADRQSNQHHDNHGHHHAELEDANVQSAMFHVLGDAVSSLGVITAAIVIWQTGWMLADPLAGLLIGMIIITGSWKVIKSAAQIMMEGTPACINLREVEEHMLSSPGVADVHDLHIWNLCSHNAILSAHVVTDDEGWNSWSKVMRDLKSRLKDEFGIEHTTLQMEHECCEKDSICRTIKP